ncbi:BRO-N domain-containing protein [Cognatishimia activa]|uniref:BRO domain-containing protein n=1 Tax=Cognatishimia activa TaxID=1715691 RepID=A0A975I8C4_9RHOB|nr:BRO family protein [Cognatishimia activa]QTN36805.1 BRO domain-containing protein [Cognatishimia activa]
MTDQLRTFEAPQLGNLKFTVWDREGEPWFIAKEVCQALDLSLRSGPSRWTVSLPKDEKFKATRNELPLFFEGSRAPSYLFISESGLYKLIMRSNKPEAAQFQDWVTKVVLPAIRKDGAYVEGEEKLASGEMSEDEFVFKVVEFADKAMEIMQGRI